MRSPNCSNTAVALISSMSIPFVQVCSGSRSRKQIYEGFAMNGLVSISPTRFDIELFGPNALDLVSFAIQELTALSGYSSSQGAD
jgi:hypothetical protein